MISRDPFYSNPHMSLVFTTVKGANLWLGDYTAAIDTKLLAKYDIQAVLTVAKELEVSYPKELTITHKIIPAIDIASYKMRPHFAECRQFILENLHAGKNILVHCSSGISRSATIVLAFLMQKLNLPYLRAHAYLKKKRHLIEPNYGFKEELIKYEKKLTSLESIKSQFKKTENSPKSINQISNYLNHQKKIENSKMMGLFQKKNSQFKSNLSSPKASVSSNSEIKQKIRIRVKSETRGSLPKIY